MAAAKRPPRMPPPKNGHHYVALIAGGPEDRAREIRDLLAVNAGIVAPYHLPYDKPASFSRPIPKDVDLILAVKSQIGHSERNKVRAAAKRLGLVWFETTHKWSAIYQHLWRFGIRVKAKADLPVEVTSTTYLREPPPAEEAPLATPPVAAVPSSRGSEAPESVPALPPKPPADPEPPLHPGLMRASPETVWLVAELQRRIASGAEGIGTVMITANEITISKA